MHLPCTSGSDRVGPQCHSLFDRRHRRFRFDQSRCHVAGSPGCLPSSCAFCQAVLWQPVPLPDEGVVHEIDQGEGGRAGRSTHALAVRPGGQHAASRAVQRQLQPGDLVFAYLDDIYVLTTHKCGTSLGVRPRGCDTIDLAVRATTPVLTTVWRGSALPWSSMILFMLTWKRHIKHTGRCSSAFLESPTSSQRCRCSCTVPVPLRSTHCEW